MSWDGQTMWLVPTTGGSLFRCSMDGLMTETTDIRAHHDAAALPEGGFGWFLIRTLTKSLNYIRQNDENCLTLVFSTK